jgi:hypothetical protein
VGSTPTPGTSIQALRGATLALRCMIHEAAECRDELGGSAPAQTCSTRPAYPVSLAQRFDSHRLHRESAWSSNFNTCLTRSGKGCSVFVCPQSCGHMSGDLLAGLTHVREPSGRGDSWLRSRLYSSRLTARGGVCGHRIVWFTVRVLGRAASGHHAGCLSRMSVTKVRLASATLPVTCQHPAVGKVIADD